MRIVKPYRTVSGALRALDNGGRFYNIFTAAGDNVVTSSELKKAAGVIGSDQLAYLFLAMSLHDLEDAQTREVMRRLDKGARDGLRRLAPALVAPKDVATMRATKACIVEGFPYSVPDHEVHGFMMIPTCSVFQVYEVFATQARKGASCRIMWPKGKWTAGKNQRFRFGGVVKQENSTEKKNSPKRLFLEPQYYTPLD